MALSRDDFEFTKQLLTAGASSDYRFAFPSEEVDKKYSQRLNLLQWAAFVGDVEAAESLLKNASTLDYIFDKRLGQWDDCTPLMIAIGNGHGEMVKYLLARGADINVFSK